MANVARLLGDTVEHVRQTQSGQLGCLTVASVDAQVNCANASPLDILRWHE